METALQLLNQRQDQDWIKGWNTQGVLQSQLSAKSLARGANRAKAWLERQDWNQLKHQATATAPAKAEEYSHGSPPAIQTEPHQASASHNPPQEPAIIRPVVLLALSDPAQFLAWFSAITNLDYPLFLADPTWGLSHWQRVDEGLDPDIIITNIPNAIIQNFHWTTYPVDNSIFLWEKQDFPQILTGCGKWIDPSSDKGLSHFQSESRFPQPVESPWIGIPTGGSSGQLRFALHRWNSLTASVSGLQESEITGDDGVINSCCTLPLHHVSGLMQFLRSLISGGQLRIVPWSLVKAYFHLGKADIKAPRKDTSLPNFMFSYDRKKFFLSLVPTQLQRLLASTQAQEWIKLFNTVLLGGAPAWPALLDRARAASIRLAPTYGMTETASQIITLHPDDFLRGQSSCGKLLPHAQVKWVPAATEGTRTIAGEPSERKGPPPPDLFQIRAHSLAWGYYNIQSRIPLALGYIGQLELWGTLPVAQDRSLLTDDLGYCDDEGYFYVVGRASNKIISGGENVFPATVEAAILATGLVKDAVVLGVADAQWGQRVVAVVVAADAILARANEEVAPASEDSSTEWSKAFTAQLAVAIAPLLSPAQRPKQWLVLPVIPRNAQGKLQRQQLDAWGLAQGQEE